MERRFTKHVFMTAWRSMSLALLLLVLTTTTTWAQVPVEINGIWYELNQASNTATVINKEGGYSGIINIPQYVIYQEYPPFIVMSIGDNAFSGCLNLAFVNIPASVIFIGDGAFNGCPNLTDINVDPENSYYSSPFGGVLFNKEGTVLVRYPAGKTTEDGYYLIPDNVTVGPNAFEGVTYPIYYTNANGDISGEQFKHLGRIDYDPNKVYVSGSVVNVEGIDFYPEGTEITLAPVGDNIFSSVPTVFNVSDPEGLVAVDVQTYTFTMPAYDVNVLVDITPTRGTFGENDALDWAMSDENQDGTLEKLTISGTGDMDGCPWEPLKSGITTVVIGDGVTSIGDNAFYGCPNLTSVIIPASVTSIGDYAFYDCTSLTTVSIPASVTSVGSDAFDNTPWLEGQPDGVVYVNKVAYKWKGDATIATITDGTVSISPWAFAGAQITSVSIPASVTSIGDYAFNGCPNLTSVIIPASVTSIGKYAFQSCIKLENVYVLPTTPPTIGYDPFNACNALTAIVVPAAAYDTYYYDDVTGWSTYQSKLKETSGNCGTTGHESDVVWRYDNGTLTISGTGQMMYYGSAEGSDGKYHSTAPWSYLDSEIQKVIVEDGVTYIGSYAFAYCTALTSVSLPASVTALGDYVCYSSNVTRIDIPGTTAATIGTGGFDFCPDGLQIAVPAHLLKNYKEAANWSAYAAKMVGVLNETTGFDNTFATGNYEYTRTFYCGVAATLCLPFELNSAQISPYGKVYTFDGVDKTTEPTWTVVMREDDPSNNVTGNLEANTPYLFVPYILAGKSKGDAMPLIFTGEVATAANAGYTSKAEGTAGAYWTFQGVYYNVAWNDGNADLGSVYGFAAQNYDGSSYTVNPGDFVKAMAGASIAPFRAFLKFTPVSGAPRRGTAEEALPSRMSVRLVNADGETTTLSEELRVKSEGFATATAWFTLDGRKLDKHPTQKGIYINGNKKIVIK